MKLGLTSLIYRLKKIGTDRFLATAVLVAAIAVFAGISYWACPLMPECVKGHVPPEFFLNRYQTLLTGLIAIYVAFFTLRHDAIKEQRALVDKHKLLIRVATRYFAQIQAQVDTITKTGRKSGQTFTYRFELHSTWPQSVPEIIDNQVHWIGLSRYRIEKLLEIQSEATFLQRQIGNLKPVFAGDEVTLPLSRWQALIRCFNGVSPQLVEYMKDLNDEFQD